MSDPIETGASRRVQNISRPRSQAIGKRQKVESSEPAPGPDQPPERVSGDKSAPKAVEKRPADEKGELELGRFSGRYGREEPVKKTAGKRKADEKDELELGRFSGRYSGGGSTRKTTGKRGAEGKKKAKPGRFSGRYSEERSAEKAAGKRSADKSAVIGPKRKKAELDKAQAKRKSADLELKIASPRDTSDDTIPSRKPARRRSNAEAGGVKNWGRLVTLALLSVILVVLTVGTFMLLPRYNVLGDPLIADPAFDAGLADWQQEGLVTYDPNEPANVSIESQDAGTPTFLTRDIELTPDEKILILRAEVQGEDVEAGPEIWDRARIYLAKLDADGAPIWDEDHKLFDLTGTTDVRNYSHAFRIPAEIDRVRVGIELKNTTGQLTVSRLELVEAERPTLFLTAAGILLAAWGVLTLYAAIRTLKGIESGGIRLSLGIACALSVAALMLPGTIHEVWIDAIAGPLGMENTDVDVVGHAVVFTILAFLVRLGRPSVPIWLHVGVWLLIAIASEAAQLFTLDREPSVEDLVVDGFGILLGLALAEIVRFMRRLRLA